MSIYKNILVSTSLTDDSKAVCDRAKALAKMSNANLSIVHIVEFNPMMYGGGEFAIPLDGDIEESIHNQAKQALSVEGERLGIVQEQQYLKSGSTSDSLLDLVKEIKADLLVMGYHEHNWLVSLMGSTSGNMLHLMPCDIIAVHL